MSGGTECPVVSSLRRTECPVGQNVRWDRMSGGTEWSGGFLPASDNSANGSDNVLVRPIFEGLVYL